MVVWRGVQGGYGVFFQTCNITHSNRLSVIDSPQCWGWCLEVGYLFQSKARLVYLYSTFHTQW